MVYELSLTRNPISIGPPAAASAPNNSEAAAHGAVISFLGVVRGSENGSRIGGLEYSAFEDMARHQFIKLFDQASRQWPIHSIRLIHRLGPVRAGDTSLWVEVTTAHRGEAFAACQWIIDQMKQVVPIWKKAIPE